MINRSDIVDDIFCRIKVILGNEFAGQIIMKLEQEEKKIRKDWGGSASYILKKRDIEQRKAIALQKIREGISVVEASKIAGISHRCAYTMLKRR